MPPHRREIALRGSEGPGPSRVSTLTGETSPRAPPRKEPESLES